MRVISTPDGGTVSFPDNMSDQQVAQILRDHFAKPRGPIADFATMFGIGVPRGTTGALAQMAGHLPATSQGLATTADDVAKLGGGALSAMHVITPQQADAARRAVTNVRHAIGPAANTADEMQQTIQQGVVDPAGALFMGHRPSEAPGLFTPQGKAGQYGSAIGNGVGASIVGPGAAVVPRLLSGAVAGGVNQGTRDALQPFEAQHPWVKQAEEPAALMASILAGSATNAVAPSVLPRWAGSGAPHQGAKPFVESTQGVGPGEMQSATNLGQTAQGMGAPLTMSDAVQAQAPFARINQLQRQAEASPEGLPLRQLFAQRPEQGSAMVKALLDNIAPEGTDPALLGSQGQEAATGALRQLESNRTAATSPLYQAADPQNVTLSVLRNGAGQTLDQVAAADKTGLIGPELTRFKALISNPDGTPITDVANLSRALKFTRERINLPPGATNAIDRQTSGILGPFLDQLEAHLNTVQPYDQANTLYRDISRSTVNPAMQGPLKGVQNAANPADQGGALYPTQPAEGQPANTVQAIDRLHAQSPGLPADLTRAYLARALNEQTQDNIPGQNEWGGPKFAANVQGNPLQGETLRAGVGAVAPKAVPQLNDTMDVLGAMGTRLRPGSETFEKLQAAGQTQLPHSIIGGIGKIASLLAGDKSAAANRYIVQQLTSDPSEWNAILQRARDQIAQDALKSRAMRGAVIGGLGYTANQSPP